MKILQSKLLQKMKSIGNVGLLPSILYAIQKLRHRRAQNGLSYRLYSRYAKYPVLCRPNSSDISVFGQIFAGREYRCLDSVQDAQLILDCGANVGYSTVYFLTRYPKARVIAIEPDPQNFAILCANVAPYGSRCRTVCSGVWSHSVGLVLSEDQFGDGREWARTVRAVRPGETPSVAAVDIGSVLEGSGKDRISILKIDIEGSEAEVFSSNYEHWIDRVDNLVIELHGPRCESIFRDAIKGANFDISQCDELTVCKRPV